jgi:predicted amidophosphoribosyltransferase
MPAAPARPDIKIRDLTRRRNCSSCGKVKTPYIEIEVDGVLEYTCQECYEGQVIEIAACRACGAGLEAADQFCGKCGAPRRVACAACGADLAENDGFCGKCGAKVTAPPS